MTETSTAARVHAAADEIEREGGKPTVATVRERAGVNNADATLHLRGWREVRATSGVTIAALPAALVEQSQRLSRLMWAEAFSLAAVPHAAVEREWRAQAALQEQEIAELVENLDTASAEAEARAIELATIEAQLLEARASEAGAQEDLQASVEARTELEKQLAEEHTSNKTLRETLAALIARIPAANESE